MTQAIGRARRLGTLGILLVVVLMSFAGAYGQQQAPVEGTLRISNTDCSGGVQITQLVYLRNDAPVRLQILSALIRLGETREFPFELSVPPTSVLIRGSAGGQTFEVNAQIGQTQYTCGTIQLLVSGESAPPTDGDVQLPPELSGIEPGMAPQQVLSRLQMNGFDLDVQGSAANPKLGDVDDPLIIGVLGPGFLTGVAYWVSAPGQLRAALIHDRPTANVVLIVVSNFGFSLSLTPPGGGLVLFSDRPAALAPTTTWGGGPVPGTTFLVLALKIGGPAMPYVLGLSS